MSFDDRPMIIVANLLDMEEEISRRSFVRRLFAMGAGIAASGSIVRSLSARFQPASELGGGLQRWAITVDKVGVTRARDISTDARHIHEWASRVMPRDETLLGYMCVPAGVETFRLGTLERGAFQVMTGDHHGVWHDVSLPTLL